MGLLRDFDGMVREMRKLAGRGPRRYRAGWGPSDDVCLGMVVVFTMLCILGPCAGCSCLKTLFR
jgi:hypothetical protein